MSKDILQVGPLFRGRTKTREVLGWKGVHVLHFEFDALDKRLAQHPYLMGDTLSVLDIAWFIYAHRLSLAGYPLARLHPRISAWVEKLRGRPEFSKEIAMPPESVMQLEATRRAQTQAGKTLETVAGF
jgi:glutathione S-transferase